MNFYLACAGIYPLLVIAALVQITELTHPLERFAVRWRLATFMLAAVTGELASLSALAANKGTFLNLLVAGLALFHLGTLLAYSPLFKTLVPESLSASSSGSGREDI